MTIGPKEEAVQFYETNYTCIGPKFTRQGSKKYLGSKRNRTCRFCGKDKSSTTFKSKAHAIPEFLGNNSIFSNYECDTCNSFFGKGIENDLGNWTKPDRTLCRIRGKRGVPSIKKIGSEQGWRIDYGATGFHIKDYEIEPNFVIDEKRCQLKFQLARDVYTPVAVLKAFVKIGLTLLPPEEIENFQIALSWIQNSVHTSQFVRKFPVIHTFFPGPMPNTLTDIKIFRRKEFVEELPYAFFILGFGNHLYQVFYPCPDLDKALDGKEISIPPFQASNKPDPVKYGAERVRPIDLCGRQPISGEKFPVTFRFEHLKVTTNGSN